MSFFRIYDSIDSKIIGVFPQVIDGVVPTTRNDPNFIENYNLRKAPASVYLPKGILEKKAKLTDLLTTSFPGFSLNLFVSELLKDIINTSNHFGMQFFESSVIIKSGQEFPYWILHAYEMGYEFLNVADSSFVMLDRKDRSKIMEQVTFNTASDVQAKYQDIQVRIEKNPNDIKFLVINEVKLKEDIAVDFFPLRTVQYGGIGYFVSERLRNAIEKAGCTGIQFFEINQRFPN